MSSKDSNELGMDKVSCIFSKIAYYSGRQPGTLLAVSDTHTLVHIQTVSISDGVVGRSVGGGGRKGSGRLPFRMLAKQIVRMFR